MKKYTEKDLLIAVKFAVEIQKASCYQVVANIIFNNDNTTLDKEVEVLDYLANEDHINITINELNDCLEIEL